MIAYDRLMALLEPLATWRRDALEAYRRAPSPAALEDAWLADKLLAEARRRLAALRERGEQSGNGMGR